MPDLHEFACLSPRRFSTLAVGGPPQPDPEPGLRPARRPAAGPALGTAPAPALLWRVDQRPLPLPWTQPAAAQPGVSPSAVQSVPAKAAAGYAGGPPAKRAKEDKAEDAEKPAPAKPDRADDGLEARLARLSGAPPAERGG